MWRQHSRGDEHRSGRRQRALAAFVHRRQVCLVDVFHRWMDRLWEQQRSLAQTRIYEPPPILAPRLAPALVPALYIGQGEDDASCRIGCEG